MSDDDSGDKATFIYLGSVAAVGALVFAYLAWRDWRAYNTGRGELRHAYVLAEQLFALERVIAGYSEGDAEYVERASLYDLKTGALVQRTREQVPRDCAAAQGTRLWCTLGDEVVLFDAAGMQVRVRQNEFAGRFSQLRSGVTSAVSQLSVDANGALRVVSNTGEHLAIHPDGLGVGPEVLQSPREAQRWLYGLCPIAHSERQQPCYASAAIAGASSVLNGRWLRDLNRACLLHDDVLDRDRAQMTLVAFDDARVAFSRVLGARADIVQQHELPGRFVLSLGPPNDRTLVLDATSGAVLLELAH